MRRAAARKMLSTIQMESTRRRLDVAFGDAMRQLTEETARRLHELIALGRTPAAVRERKCDRCSLVHLCLPEAMGTRRSAQRYLSRALEGVLEDGFAADLP